MPWPLKLQILGSSMEHVCVEYLYLSKHWTISNLLNEALILENLIRYLNFDQNNTDPAENEHILLEQIKETFYSVFTRVPKFPKNAVPVPKPKFEIFGGYVPFISQNIEMSPPQKFPNFLHRSTGIPWISRFWCSRFWIFAVLWSPQKSLYDLDLALHWSGNLSIKWL